MKTLQEIELNEVTENVIFNDYNYIDLAHEYADSSEEVIYYYKAKEYVNNHDDLDNLEDEWKDLEMEFQDLNTLYTQLAFIGVKNDYLEQFEEELKGDLELLKELLMDNEVELDCIEYDREEEISKMEEIQNQIEEAIENIQEQI